MENIWKCDDCEKLILDGEFAIADHPFINEEKINGCPKCGSVGEFLLMCDEDGCEQESTCGFPTEKYGYRRTCGLHYRLWNKFNQVKEVN